MKTVLSKLSDRKAQEEVKKYSYVSLALSVVSLFVFWWLAIAGVALGARAFVLTYHRGNKANKDLTKFRVLSGGALVAGLASLIWSLTA